MLVAAVATCTPLPCLADPEETSPEAAALDLDYAAGKQALERKDWQEAARHFSQAALRDPDNADLHNYLGYAYRHLGKLDLASAERHLEELRKICLLPCEELADLEREIAEYRDKSGALRSR